MQGSETSQYLREKRTIVYFLSSGERKGSSPNQYCVRKIQFMIRVAMIKEVNPQSADRAVLV